MLYVSGQAGPRVSFLCRMLQIVIYRSKVIRMKCSLRWSCINHGELHCDSVDSSLLFFFFKKMWVFWLERVFPSLVIVFLIRLTVFGLFCYCHFVIRQTMVSVLQANLFSCRTGFVFSCFYKSNFLKMFSFVARTVQPQQPFFLRSFDLEHYN